MASDEVQAGRRWPRRLQPSGTILSKGKGEDEVARRGGGRVEAEGDGGSSGVVAAGVGGGVNGIPIQIGSGGSGPSGGGWGRVGDMG